MPVLSTTFDLVDRMSEKLNRMANTGSQFVKQWESVGDTAGEALETASKKATQTAQSLSALEDSMSDTTTAADRLNTENKDGSQIIEEFTDRIEVAERAVSDYADGVDRGSRSTGEFGDESKDAGEKVKVFGDETTQAINAIEQVLVAAGIAKLIREIGSAFVDVTRASMEFESAITGVYKTVDGTEEQLANISNEIKEMALMMPASTTEIAAVAEAAGQLGIAVDDITNFTRVMIDLGESTNLSSEVAASSLAKFANVAKMSADNYQNLGSVIVALGNNFATTEADIVAMATNMASAASLAGFTEAETMALAAALSSVGIEAAAGGTSAARLISSMQVAVETGNEELANFAKVAGVTAREFTEIWKKGPVDALYAFIKGLNDTERTGQTATVMLENMGITEVRLSNAIKALANDNEGLAAAIETANLAWEENTALSTEASLRYGTLESQIDMTKNASNNLSIAIGDVFSPTIADANEKWREVLVGFTSFVENNPTVVKAVAAITVGVAAFTGSIVAYVAIAKAATVITTALNAIMAANPAFLIGAGIASAAVALTAFSVSTAKSSEQLKKANLDAHFGDIALSAAEIDEIVGKILRDDSLGKLNRAFSAFDTVAETAENISAALDEIDRANWKVSIGMDFTESDFERYKSDIDSFIENSLKLVSDKHYAISLSIDTLFGDSETGSDFKSSADSLYGRYSTELEELGKKLQEAVLQGYESGWDVDTTQAVESIIKSMTEITDKIAAAQAEARLEAIKLDFLSGNIDAESFENLQTRLNEELENITKQYDDLRLNLIAEARLEFNEGEIDQETLNQRIDSIQEQYEEKLAALSVTSLNFQTDAILQAYSDEIGEAIPQMAEALQRGIEEQMSNMDWFGAEGMDIGLIYAEIWESTNIDKATKDAIGQLLENMKPTYEQVYEIARSYEEVPAEIAEALFGAAALNVIGSKSKEQMKAMATVIGAAFSTADPEYQKMLNDLNDAGIAIPEEVIFGMNARTDQLKQTGTSLGENVLDALKTKLEEGINVRIPVTASASSNISLNVPGFATGTTDAPDIFIAGEEGPELIVGAAGSTVFPAEETEKILSSVGRVPIRTEVPETFRISQSSQDSPAVSEKVIRLQIEGGGEIKVDASLKEDQVLDLLFANLRPALLSIVRQEIFEEGDGAYEF